jgi:tRNA nucleotidyltransferase/poly(A) polymerase
MSDITPRVPSRPLIWPDLILDLQDLLHDYAAPVYVVGGAVRDALLHRPFKDLDLITTENAVKLARLIANHFKGDFFVLDDERDVGRALVDTPEGLLVIDVARFRGSTLLDDLTDRDFTVNAMAVDLHADINQLIDPLGGEGDAAAKRIRQCSPHAVQQDPIRALRAVRQSVQLSMRIEPETQRNIRTHAALMADISPERVRDELFKLLTLPKVVMALRVADALGLLKFVLPELDPLHGLQQGKLHVFDAWEHTLAVVENLGTIFTAINYSRTDNTAATFSLGTMVIQLDRYRTQLNAHINATWPNERSHRALLMLTALLHDAGKAAVQPLEENGDRRFIGHDVVGARMADERALALRLSNDERTRLVTIIREHMHRIFWDELTPLAIHRFWRRLGEVGVDLCLFVFADYLGARSIRLEQSEWLKFVERVRVLLQAYYERYDQLVAPPTLIDGNQLMQTFNLRPGPIIGQLLDLIREAQVMGEVQSADDAVRLAEAHLNQQH